jgi:hypothetical protein
VGDLFRQMSTRLQANARRAVEGYASELAEYRAVQADPRGYAEMLDFAVFLRERTILLATDHQPFTVDDLAVMAAAGRERGERGVSLAAHRQVLLLYARFTLQDLHEAAGPGDVHDLLRMLGWLAPQGAASAEAYTTGYLAGQKEFLPIAARAQLLARMLIADDPLVGQLARDLGVPLADNFLVIVLRIPGDPFRPTETAEAVRKEIVSKLFARHRVPITWAEPEELMAILAAPGKDPVRMGDPVQQPALSFVADFTELWGRPYAIGTALGAAPALAIAVALARQTSQVAPIEVVPRRIYTMTDMFVELGVAQVPWADKWLREMAEQLAGGPDLVTTLDAYYRNDMHRLRTAASLIIHPRTLDYRLQRVRELTGMDPGSTRGVRVLSTVVAKALASAWQGR